MGRRWIIVDDTDDQIRYQGDWTEDRDASEVGNFGPPFMGTQHAATNTAAASISFTFSGMTNSHAAFLSLFLLPTSGVH